MNYLDSGYLYYGSRLGDSVLIQLETESTGDKDRPYLTIKDEYLNLGCISDMTLVKDKRGQQSTLYALGGSG